MRDYRKEFKDHCLTCKEYDIYSYSDSTHRGFRCKHHHRPMAFDESCSSYDFDKVRGNNQIDDAVSFRVRKGYDPKPDSSYWYVVSTICKILSIEYGEDRKEQISSYLNAFKDFREFAISIQSGIEFLGEYDVNGLRLANKLLDAYNENKEQTLLFMESELLPTMDSFAKMVSFSNYPGAMKFYTRLMASLGLKYSYKPVEIEDKKSIQPELIGPGRVRNLLQSMD